MGLFKKLFGAKSPSEGNPVTDEEVGALRALLGERADEQAVQKGMIMLQRSLSPQQRRRVERTVGLGLFHLRNFEQAMTYLEPLSVDSLDPMDHFNVASCAIMAGKIDQGLAALEKTLELFPEHGNDSMPPPPFMMFFTMQALLERQAFTQAFEFLQRLFSIYAVLGFTDMTLLRLRGVPPFYDTLSKAMPLFFNPIAANALVELRKDMDDDGKAVIDSLIQHLKDASKWPLTDGDSQDTAG